MPDRSFQSWPFFEPHHRALAEQLEAWADNNLAHVAHDDVDATCRKLVAVLGRDGWLKHTAPDPATSSDKLDVRTLALIRETLARHSGLADFAFRRGELGPLLFE